MAKTIALVGTLDTKSQEYAYLQAEIARHGCHTLLIDVGVLGRPALEADVPRERVAEAGGATLAPLATGSERGPALEVMARGAAAIVRDLHIARHIDGIVGMGGGGGTALATAAMRALPIGVPKLMVSTLASGDTSPYVGVSDIVMMPAVVDIAGLNRISRGVIRAAAGAICGMVLAAGGEEPALPERPMIAATMFGNTTPAVGEARRLLEARGYEVVVFHATGAGGRTMESLIDAGYFAGVLDITTTEWADELCGGVLSAGPGRLEAAARTGVPQVVAPGCLDMCNFWAMETVPSRYQDRRFYAWNPNVTLMRTTPEENARLGQIFAARLNASRGPCIVLVPSGGYSQIDLPGGPFYWPEADRAFVAALRHDLRPDIPIVEMAVDVNHPQFAARAVDLLIGMLGTPQPNMAPNKGAEHGSNPTQ